MNKADIKSYVYRFNQATNSVGKLGSEDGKNVLLLAATMLA
jgi:hypothetical protein